MTSQALNEASPSTPRITIRANAWIVLPYGALVAGVLSNNLLLLNYLHVMCAILWTGADIFMAFLLGPILSKVTKSSRKEIASWLMPKLIFYLSTMTAVTIIAGYFLGVKLGLMNFAPPIGYYVAAVIILVIILIIQGFGMLLPTNVRVYRELRKVEPDYSYVENMMKHHAGVFTRQSIAQILIIFIMANFATSFPLLYL
ncbi:MAG: hypothetical protein ACRECH_09610 [Nitrososphaerales archaeon]